MRPVLLCCAALTLAGCQSPKPATQPASRPTTAAASFPEGSEGDWARMRPITPRGYVCRRARSPVTVDGKADEPAWADAPWTADFADIEGDRRPAPRFRTRAKMLWDDDNLYVYAELEEPHVRGTITRKNEVIFQDNDFEIFIDPDGDNHNYYEFEINALNTLWELTLVKPYRDDGPALSPTNLAGLRTAVHLDGTLNDPSDTDRGWSVEVAIPWSGLARYAAGRPCPPRDGQQWRVNFSRVEWLADIIGGRYRKIPVEMRPEDNWVWSPQGVVDLHRPERWGYVQFSAAAPGEESGTAAFHPDPTLPARDALMGVYYRQREFRKQTGRYAGSAGELGTAGGGAGAAPPVEITGTAGGYVATARLTRPDGSARTLHVREDSKLWEDAAGPGVNIFR